MTRKRNHWNRAQLQWAKKPSHDDDAPSSSRNASGWESSFGDSWNYPQGAEALESQGVWWNLPSEFEGANREEYRVIFDWNDSAGQKALHSRVKPNLQDYLAHCDKYSALIDWESRWLCDLPDCAEALTREENKRKAKGSYTRDCGTRVGSPVIIGLPEAKDIGGNAGSSIHLPLFAVPPATGWGDEGDMVPAPTGWDEGNTAPPTATGWGYEGEGSVHLVSGWEDKKELGPERSGWDDERFGHCSGSGVERPVVPFSAEVAARLAVSERDDVIARPGPFRWAEVAARSALSETAGVATEIPLPGLEKSTVETRATPAAFREPEPIFSVASGLDDLSRVHDPMNPSWMQHPTFPNNPESYKHIVPSGWGDFPEESAPTPDTEINPYGNSCQENWVGHDLPRSSLSEHVRGAVSYGNVHHEKQRHGSSGPVTYSGSDYWKNRKESEALTNFEPHYRRNPQRSGRSPIANNLRVNQDSKPSRGTRWDREERTTLLKNVRRA